MTKITFSNHELERFLLVGEKNQYIIDRINPRIRAFKRKNSLAIFSTIRIKKKTTTVKLGDFPECSLEEIYAKFEVAQKISKNGNNPNLVFNSFNNFTGINRQDFNNLSINEILTIFFKKNRCSQKYINDIKHNLKKNLKNLYYEPLIKLNFKNISNSNNILRSQKKFATSKNFLNYLQTIINFSINNNLLKEKDQPIELINSIKRLKTKIKINPLEKTLVLRKVLIPLKKLNEKQLLDVFKFIKKIKK